MARDRPARWEHRNDVDIHSDGDRAQALSPILADLVASTPHPRPDRILKLAAGRKHAAIRSGASDAMAAKYSRSTWAPSADDDCMAMQAD
jgi:hypothetical protein